MPATINFRSFCLPVFVNGKNMFWGQNRVLSRIFGHKSEEVAGDRRNLNSESSHAPQKGRAPQVNDQGLCYWLHMQILSAADKVSAVKRPDK